MAQQIVMPKQGNSVESCILVEWKKKVGEEISIGDILCSAETDKSTIDVESTAEGTVLTLLFAEGDEIPVMVPIAVVGEKGEQVDAALLEAAPSITDENKESVASVSLPAEPQPTIQQAATVSFIGAKISPRAKKLAAEQGIPVQALQPTGPKNRIIERDVRNAMGQPLSPAAKDAALAGNILPPLVGSGIGGRVLSSDLNFTKADVPASVATTAVPQETTNAPFPGPITTIPVKGIRKVTAKRMMESMHGTCQLTLNAFADARAMKKLRSAFKASSEDLNLNGITLNDLVLFALSRTLPQFPAFNAHFMGDSILRFEQVHIGMATDTPRGLLVPVIRNADKLTLSGISDEAKRLALKCKDGSATTDDLTGSTITVSNVGSFGIESFTPVLNKPEVAILGVGCISLKAVEGKSGEVEFIPHIGLSLTMDHQAVDGADAARFLKKLMDNIASIDILLAK
ncbi:pyruvate/2-oxoglutarate dehydrogenase complex, dihydrolipoamide acyltransferase component [Sphaerochaeta pleomorpha str. Grapes]|uniref:Dihydrolipoamide acetyltransferase component of pyruvate dehydrogenase complex n=1 Tax=Sphaerochaeta pleomorpha (strain ATCC BAA-1885 / DSM 22778 / Grapes) TaxID=158190 RepID=G8QUP1_SPHPG|nr:dihydrolipoamide acetyltransferase family protein [Sphaerochaeta pleomorpha]AEV30349.1 pyruvate/2-oxoglutarate dehydrogenase complex, dihydrolipoamide acyltransferase component [Sphaerochaeta pleomorpha str. Grapes]